MDADRVSVHALARSSGVAGLDLGLADERAADHAAFALAATLSSSGVVTVTIGTHPVAEVGRVPRVGLSVELHETDADAAFALLCAAAPGLSDEFGAGDWALRVAARRWGSDALVDVAGSCLNRDGGRAAVFPGQDSLVGVLTAEAVVTGSAIVRLAALAGGEVAADGRIDTRNFVRPRWVGTELVLHLQPARGGLLVPFEVPNPTPCCAHH